MALGLEDVPGWDHRSLAVLLLIHDGFAQADLAPVCPEDQIAQGINGHAVHALERERDRLGIGAGGDHEVVFELPLVAVIDQVHPGVDVPVLDLHVCGNVGAPLLGIIADEVVAFARQLTDPGHRWRGVGAEELHAQHCSSALFRLDKPGLAGNSMLGVRVCLSEHEHRLGGGQEQGIAAAAGEELDLWFGLPLVCLEAQWQLPVGSQDLRLGRLRALGRWMRR